MASNRPKAPSFVSFKGTFVFPKLSEPDYGNKDYPKPDGEFSTKIKGDANDAEVKALIAKLEPFHSAAVAQAEEEFKALKIETRKKLGKITVNPLFETEYDEDEEPTGNILFKFSMKYSGTFKKGPKEGKVWKRVPAIFDAKGNKLPYFDKQNNPIPNMPAIWGGTVGRVSFELGLNKEGKPGYFVPATGAAGLSLKLQAVRIIDLVSGGQRSASDYGFDQEEEGYTKDEADFSQPESSTTEGKTDGGVAASDDNPDF